MVRQHFFVTLTLFSVALSLGIKIAPSLSTPVNLSLTLSEQTLPSHLIADTVLVPPGDGKPKDTAGTGSAV